MYKYYVVYDLRDKRKKTTAGWKRLYTYSTDTENYLVEYKQITTNEDLIYYRGLSAVNSNIKVFTNEELTDWIITTTNGYEQFGFKIKIYYKEKAEL